MITNEKTTENIVAHGIREVIQSIDPDSGMLPDCIHRISTFEEVGMLTTNKGLVLTMDDGTEFQITIVKSK
ncbi:MAG: hypothetical protein HZA50_13865 [Planctomycetes bacterium]|nr:hypothetical protein [Planctomycetota bacterium]